MGFLVVVFVFGGILMSMVLHEYGHAWAAYVSGDDTAAALGRLTLNPLKHIDPFMTIILPIVTFWIAGFIFGGAKPVPINPYRFRNFRRDYRFVSIAGVTINLIIAAVCSLMIHVLKLEPTDGGGVIFGMIAFFNVIIAFFNLVPIPPLDGSRVLRTFLSERGWAAFDRADRYGMFLVMVFVMFGLFRVVWPVIGWIWVHVLRLGSMDFGLMFETFGEYFRSMIG